MKVFKIVNFSEESGIDCCFLWEELFGEQVVLVPNEII